MEGYAMKEDTVVGLARPGGTVEDDPLLAVLREGARQMLSLAIEAEVAAFLAVHADRVDQAGRRRLVRHGHAPKRSIQTGIGPIEVRRPRGRDRGADDESERIRLTSAVLPAYLRRTRNVEELLPWPYLKGISTGQFEDTLKVLLGPDAPGLSAATIRRLVATWQDEHQRWQARDLSAKRYLYVWADGVYFAPRLEHDRQCILVLIGADAGGKKELLAVSRPAGSCAAGTWPTVGDLVEEQIPRGHRAEPDRAVRPVRIRTPPKKFFESMVVADVAGAGGSAAQNEQLVGGVGLLGQHGPAERHDQGDDAVDPLGRLNPWPA